MTFSSFINARVSIAQTKLLRFMKNYQKAELIAKNLPTGSYAAGCPAEGTGSGHMYGCHACERTM